MLWQVEPGLRYAGPFSTSVTHIWNHSMSSPLTDFHHSFYGYWNVKWKDPNDVRSDPTDDLSDPNWLKGHEVTSAPKPSSSTSIQQFKQQIKDGLHPDVQRGWQPVPRQDKNCMLDMLKELELNCKDPQFAKCKDGRDFKRVGPPAGPRATRSRTGGGL